MGFVEKFIAVVYVAGLIGCVYLFITDISDQRKEKEHFKQVCTEQKGTVVYNGRNLECLK